MTWPFENDTSAIVKKLADRSMKADKRRNAFIIITIAFAVSLMMVLALYNLGTDRENRLYLQGRYQSSFINSTSTVFEKLEHNNQIESVGKEAAMGTSRINDYTLDVYYRDQNALELKGVTDLLGKMPEAENEIIVDQSYLEHLGLPVQLDQTVTLDMPFGENQTYHVCGIIQSRNASRIYQVIVSNGLYSRYGKANCYDLLVRLKNTENMDSETLKLLINEIAEQSGVSELYWPVLWLFTVCSTFLLSGKHMSMADCVCWGLHRFRSSVSCEKKIFCYPVLQFLSALYWEVFWAIVSCRTAGIG